MNISRSTASNSRSSELEPVRRGSLSNPVILLLLALAVLLAAYALRYLPQLATLFGHFFNEAFLSSQHAGATELTPAVYGIASLVAFFVLLALLRTIGILLRKVSGRETFAPRTPKSIEQFVEEAAAAKIGQRVARESYHLLLHHYPHHMSISLEDSLRLDLNLTSEDILTLRSTLLARSSRRHIAIADSAGIITVRDLLAHAEATPEQRKDRSGSHNRASDPPTEEEGFVASDSLIGSHIRTREHIANLQRRAADYTGPRRRATDNRVNPEYVGPRRRSTDCPVAFPPQPSDGESKP
jgi:hypothetical protein